MVAAISCTPPMRLVIPWQSNRMPLTCESYARGRPRAYAGFLHEVDLPPERFDVVFHVDLMSHFVDPLDALRTMRRATRPGGVVAFEVGLLAGCHRDGTVAAGCWCPQHRWLYSKSDLLPARKSRSQTDSHAAVWPSP